MTQQNGERKPWVRSVQPRQFMFATGIENSYPTIELPNGNTKRVDEMEKCRHYQHWRDDFSLVKELDIEFLRYGPPYYSTHTGPGKYDWDFADETFNALHDQGITPIADLCHSACRTGWKIFRTRIFRSSSRSTHARLPSA